MDLRSHAPTSIFVRHLFLHLSPTALPNFVITSFLINKYTKKNRGEEGASAKRHKSTILRYSWNDTSASCVVLLYAQSRKLHVFFRIEEIILHRKQRRIEETLAHKVTFCVKKLKKTEQPIFTLSLFSHHVARLDGR